jgi:hypothetical protein
MNATNNAYTIVSLVFFFTYAVGQPPATVMIRKMGPRVFLSCIVFAWGAVMIVSPPFRVASRLTAQGFGFVHSWQAMAGLRVVLGLFEAGFYPGCVYLLSTWCKSSFTIYCLYSKGKIYNCIFRPAVRAAKAECRVLPHRQHGVRVWWHPGVRDPAAGRPGGTRRLAVDIHCECPRVCCIRVGVLSA